MCSRVTSPRITDLQFYFYSLWENFSHFVLLSNNNSHFFTSLVLYYYTKIPDIVFQIEIQIYYHIQCNRNQMYFQVFRALAHLRHHTSLMQDLFLLYFPKKGEILF